LFLLRYGLGLAGYSIRCTGRFTSLLVFWVALPLGHVDIGDPLSVPLGLADRRVRTAEAMTVVRGDDGRVVSADSHRPPMVLYWLIPYPTRARACGQLQIAAHLDEFRSDDFTVSTVFLSWG